MLFRSSITKAEASLLEALESGDDDAALARLREAAEKPDSSAALLFALAAHHAQTGRQERAATLFARCLERQPDFRRARKNLALLQLQAEAYDAAAANVAVLISGGEGGDANTWKLLGYARFSAGDVRAAEAAYRNAYALNPDDEETRRGLIRTRLQLGRADQARELIEEERARQPLDASLWQLLASDDLQNDERPDALVRFEAMRYLGMSDTRTLLAAGDLLLDQGLSAEAAQRYLAAETLGDTAPDRLLRAAEGLLTRGEVDAADTLLGRIGKRALSSAADKRHLAFLKARLLEARRDEEGALATYQALLKTHPLDPPLLLRTARLLQRRGNLAEAHELYVRVERNATGSRRQSALVRLAQIAVERDDIPRAVERLETALRIKPADYIRDYLQRIQTL